MRAEVPMIDHFKGKNLQNLVNCTPIYGVYKNGDLSITPLLKDMVKKFFDAIVGVKGETYLMVSQRKVLLHQVYKNLFQQLSVYNNVKVKYVDELYPGSFTNYKSSKFLQPDQCIILLTKNYNSKQLRLIKELSKTKISVSIIALGKPFYHRGYNVINIRNIKSLYWFMYTYLTQRNLLTYREFSKLFAFSKQPYNFKAV